MPIAAAAMPAKAVRMRVRSSFSLGLVGNLFHRCSSIESKRFVATIAWRRSLCDRQQTADNCYIKKKKLGVFVDYTLKFRLAESFHGDCFLVT